MTRPTLRGASPAVHQGAAMAQPVLEKGSGRTDPAGADDALSSRWRRFGGSESGFHPWIIRITVLAATLLMWWLVTRLELVKPLYLPSPGSVWDAFVRANTDHPVSEGSDRVVRGEQNYY